MMNKLNLKMLCILAFALLYVGCAHHEARMKSNGEKQDAEGFTKSQRFQESLLKTDKEPSPPPPAPVRAPAPPEDGWGTARMPFPTGVEATSTILVEKRFPKRVHAGQPYYYTIKVTNLTDLTLQNVNIIEEFPNSFEVLSTDPAIYETSGEKVAWALGKMGPHEERTITVRGVARNTSGVPCCTSANFRIPALCLSTTVVDSGLELSVSAPAEKMVCDTIPLTYVVRNAGESHLDNVTINAAIPGNATAAGGLSLPVGALGPGEQRTVETVVSVTSPGDYNFGGTASGVPTLFTTIGTEAITLNADANTATTRVTQPSLTLAAYGKESKQYVGRNLNFEYEVANNGGANADGTVVTASIPANTAFQSATEGGIPSAGGVSWNLGTLAPNQSRRVAVTLKATGGGEAMTSAQATANCVAAATASASKPIVGVAALLLELIDVNDPLEVGQSTVYQIRVTNQGNALATNVKLTGGFEDMSYVSGSGDTPVSNSGTNLEFGAVSLNAKESASWNVTLKALGVGDHRFRLEMNADQLSRPVNETESTTVY